MQEVYRALALGATSGRRDGSWAAGQTQRGLSRAPSRRSRAGRAFSVAGWGGQRAHRTFQQGKCPRGLTVADGKLAAHPAVGGLSPSVLKGLLGSQAASHTHPHTHDQHNHDPGQREVYSRSATPGSSITQKQACHVLETRYFTTGPVSKTRRGRPGGERGAPTYRPPSYELHLSVSWFFCMPSARSACHCHQVNPWPERQIQPAARFPQAVWEHRRAQC